MEAEPQTVIPCVRRLGPAVRIALTLPPREWPTAIEAIADLDERRWADHWLRQQAKLLRLRRERSRTATTESQPRVGQGGSAGVRHGTSKDNQARGKGREAYNRNQGRQETRGQGKGQGAGSQPDFLRGR